MCEPTAEPRDSGAMQETLEELLVAEPAWRGSYSEWLSVVLQSSRHDAHEARSGGSMRATLRYCTIDFEKQAFSHAASSRCSHTQCAKVGFADIVDVRSFEPAAVCPRARPVAEQPYFPIILRFDCGGVKELRLLANDSKIALTWSERLQVAWRLGLLTSVGSSPMSTASRSYQHHQELASPQISPCQGRGGGDEHAVGLTSIASVSTSEGASHDAGDVVSEGEEPRSPSLYMLASPLRIISTSDAEAFAASSERQHQRRVDAYSTALGNSDHQRAAALNVVMTPPGAISSHSENSRVFRTREAASAASHQRTDRRNMIMGDAKSEVVRAARIAADLELTNRLRGQVQGMRQAQLRVRVSAVASCDEDCAEASSRLKDSCCIDTINSLTSNRGDEKVRLRKARIAADLALLGRK
jgi:hypothetical protein